MAYTEPQRNGALPQEQLDWLQSQHAELAEQTRLLTEIARHTRLQYILTWIALVAAALAVFAWLIVMSKPNGTATIAIVVVWCVCAAVGWGAFKYEQRRR